MPRTADQTRSGQCGIRHLPISSLAGIFSVSSPRCPRIKSETIPKSAEMLNKNANFRRFRATLRLQFSREEMSMINLRRLLIRYRLYRVCGFSRLNSLRGIAR